MTEPFDPVSTQHLADSVANKMLSSNPTPLADIPAFFGAGVYAIYYHGALPVYSTLVAATLDGEDIPIYVGKAVPRGSRRGVGVEHGTTSRALSLRLREHATSVGQADDLDIADFTCRWLVVEPFWIPLGESVTISRFAPVWNAIVSGFGIHDPGMRRQNLRTRWDTLHPGRPWAQQYPARTETKEDIAADVVEYLAQRYQV